MSNFVPVKLAYNTFEPAGGADESLSPIIFLHGVTGSKENWSKIPQYLADETKRRAYALDARNHGDSEYTDAFNFDLNVDDLFHFMDTIHVPKAILVGHSMGGITSIKAALRKPERVEVVVSEDMFVKKCPKETMEMVYGLISLWILGVKSIPKNSTKEEAITHTIDFLFSRIPPGTPNIGSKEQLRNIGVDFVKTSDGCFDVKFNKDVVMGALKNYDSETRESITGQYNGPAYFIYGQVSPFNVAKDESIKKHFPRVELIEIENATHNVHMEFPEKFSQTVLQCLLK